MEIPTQSLVTDGDKLKLRTRKIRAEIVEGPDAGRTVELAGPTVLVGSGPEADLVLTDPTVSRAHLTLKVDDIGLRLLDSGSRNGTLLDGIRVRDAWVRHESLIQLGQSALRLGLLDDFVELPLSSRERFGNLHGRSIAMRRVFSLLERIAASDASVLIEGETGTGKELVAEALHDEGQREKGAFIVFDCSAVSANLFESELFGHVKGSFTGAVGDREGAFEAADGGTLFLDEIGELPLDLQPKLLRALERHEVRRVGANHPVEVDVRIVAATNRDLAREVERGRFREDLYYRLNVVKLHVPPLRERVEDIPLLVDLFVAQMKKQNLPRDSVKAFMTQAWPGNVRELRNAVERALSIGAAPRPSSEMPAAAPVAVGADLAVPLKLGLDRLVADYERAYVVAALEKTGGNVTRAAELAGVNRKFIQRAMHRFGLDGK